MSANKRGLWVVSADLELIDIFLRYSIGPSDEMH